MTHVTDGSKNLTLRHKDWNGELTFDNYDEGAETSIFLSAPASDPQSFNQNAYQPFNGLITHSLRSRVYKGQSIWFKWAMYFPTGYDYLSSAEVQPSGGRLKFMRLHTYDSSSQNSGYVDMYINHKDSPYGFQSIYEGQQQWSTMFGTDKLPAFDQWQEYQMMVTLDDQSVDEGGQGMIRFWRNDELIHERTSIRTLTDSAGYATDMHYNTYWNGGAPATQTMYVDNFYATTIEPDFTDSNGNPKIPSEV